MQRIFAFFLIAALAAVFISGCATPQPTPPGGAPQSVAQTNGPEGSHASMVVIATDASMYAPPTTPPKSAPKPKSQPRVKEPKIAKKIDMEVGADQSVVLDNKKMQVADIPDQLANMHASEHLIMIIMPESKLQPETLVAMLNLLEKKGYYFSLGDGSKYAEIITNHPAYIKAPPQKRSFWDWWDW